MQARRTTNSFHIASVPCWKLATNMYFEVKFLEHDLDNFVTFTTIFSIKFFCLFIYFYRICCLSTDSLFHEWLQTVLSYIFFAIFAVKNLIFASGADVHTCCRGSHLKIIWRNWHTVVAISAQDDLKIFVSDWCQWLNSILTLTKYIMIFSCQSN